jgi:hypothetical protein
MNRVCLAGLVCAPVRLDVLSFVWGPLLTQVVYFVETVLLLLICVPLGAVAVYGVWRAGILVAQARAFHLKRREIIQRVRAQHIAEMEAMAGHGVVKEGTCPVCQAPLVLGAKFCSRCGKRVTPNDDSEVIVCPACLSANPAAGRYCSECGKPLREPVL